LGGVVETLFGGLIDSVNISPNVADDDHTVFFVEG
jgi:hypothetical protein